jgi:hypothetical protein
VLIADDWHLLMTPSDPSPVVMAVHLCSLATSPRRMFMITVSAMSSAL